MAIVGILAEWLALYFDRNLLIRLGVPTIEVESPADLLVVLLKRIDIVSETMAIFFAGVVAYLVVEANRATIDHFLSKYAGKLSWMCKTRALGLALPAVSTIAAFQHFSGELSAYARDVARDIPSAGVAVYGHANGERYGRTPVCLMMTAPSSDDQEFACGRGACRFVTITADRLFLMCQSGPKARRVWIVSRSAVLAIKDTGTTIRCPRPTPTNLCRS